MTVERNVHKEFTWWPHVLCHQSMAEMSHHIWHHVREAGRSLVPRASGSESLDETWVKIKSQKIGSLSARISTVDGSIKFVIHTFEQSSLFTVWGGRGATSSHETSTETQQHAMLQSDLSLCLEFRCFYNQKKLFEGLWGANPGHSGQVDWAGSCGGVKEVSSVKVSEHRRGFETPPVPSFSAVVKTAPQSACRGPNSMFHLRLVTTKISYICHVTPHLRSYAEQPFSFHLLSLVQTSNLDWIHFDFPNSSYNLESTVYVIKPFLVMLSGISGIFTRLGDRCMYQSIHYLN